MTTPKSLKALPRYADGLSFLYVEQAVIEREARAIAIFSADGEVRVPCAGLGALALGPGTRITHAAVAVLAECGVSVLWVGEDSLKYYAAGTGKSRSSANLMRQAATWADPAQRLAVVRRLYLTRFDEKLPAHLSLQQIRGREGVRVREAYVEASRQFGVPWAGRRYERGDWGAADPVNRAISSASAMLYGLCHAGIVANGYSPGLGFIHTGKALSFVYDVADIYKANTVIPAAFEAAAGGASGVEARARRLLRATLQAENILARIPRDLADLFGAAGPPDPAEQPDEDDAPGALWDPSGDLSGGINHASDDP